MSSQTQAPITPNRYLLARGIARRARHLFHGAKPLAGTPVSMNPARTAEREFVLGLAQVRMAGKIVRGT